MLNKLKYKVRIQDIEIINFKNTRYGKIDISSADTFDEGVDIKGIYGQNGSGKTSIINAMNILKQLLMGLSLPSHTSDFILQNEDLMEINTSYRISLREALYRVEYKVRFSNDDTINLKSEILTYSEYLEDKNTWTSKKSIINDFEESSITPHYQMNNLKLIYSSENDVSVQRILSKKEKRSFFFSEELNQQIQDNLNHVSSEYHLIYALHTYALNNLFIIENQQLAYSDASIFLPVNVKHNHANDTEIRPYHIDLSEPTRLTSKDVDDIKKSLEASNMVLSKMIPDLSIEVVELGNALDHKGNTLTSFELVSSRNETKIPIRYESDGIKKIISVLHLLIAMFNNDSTSVFIDELDAGIYEYLLGEILEVILEQGKGQLVFTSHNLRPLEVLQKKNLIFTTTNPNNRYIKLRNIKTNNNIRDTYFREIILDTQQESLYEDTNSAMIARAFRKAGDVIE